MTPGDSTAARGDARRLWRSLVGILGLAAFASAWILTRETPVTLGGDAEMLQHPLLTDAFRQLRAGKLPVWTVGRWGGSHPSDLLTPFPHWRALDVSTCLHLTLLVTGMVCFLTRPGVGPVAAVVCAGRPA